MPLLLGTLSFYRTQLKNCKNRISLVETCSTLNDVEAKVVQNPYKQKWELLVSKNPDLEIFKEYADVLKGNCFQTGSTPEKPLKFQNSSMASAEMERVFSKMSAFLTPQRQKLTFDWLNFHLTINWKAEDINNDDNYDDCG